jgi:hypothetical protein
MIAARLIELIEIHAPALSSDIARDLRSNARTRGFHEVAFDDLQHRVFAIVHHLGDWIGDPRSDRVAKEFAEWGERRFDQQIPLSEIIYGVIVLKEHLQEYIQAHGLIDATFPRVEADYVLPLHLLSLQELNATVGRFFDEAMYHLVRGYEAERAKTSPGAAIKVG